MHDLVIRHAQPDDLDQVWPLARDFATSFRPVRESFEPTFHRLLHTSSALFVAGAFYLALGYDESATFFKKATPRDR